MTIPTIKGPFPPLIIGGFVPCPECKQNCMVAPAPAWTIDHCHKCWRPLKAGGNGGIQKLTLGSTAPPIYI